MWLESLSARKVEKTSDVDSVHSPGVPIWREDLPNGELSDTGPKVRRNRRHSAQRWPETRMDSRLRGNDELAYQGHWNCLKQ